MHSDSAEGRVAIGALVVLAVQFGMCCAGLLVVHVRHAIVGNLLPSLALLVVVMVDRRLAAGSGGSLVEHLVGGMIGWRKGFGRMRRH